MRDCRTVEIPVPNLKLILFELVMNGILEVILAQYQIRCYFLKTLLG